MAAPAGERDGGIAGKGGILSFEFSPRKTS